MQKQILNKLPKTYKKVSFLQDQNSGSSSAQEEKDLKYAVISDVLFRCAFKGHRICRRMSKATNDNPVFQPSDSTLSCRTS